MSAVRKVLLDAPADCRSQLAGFTACAAERFGLTFEDPIAFHRFSVERWRDFWGLLLEWAGPIVEGETEPVCRGDDVETAEFFPGLWLNYTENMLAGGGATPEAIAVIAIDEDGSRVACTRGELDRRVQAAARGLAARGLGRGDQVVAVARNDLETVVAALAAVGLGASWSSVAPDLGPEAVLNRFKAVEPRWLFAHGRAAYQGRDLEISALLTRLREELPGLEQVVDLGEDEDLTRIFPDAVALRSLETAGGWRWERLPFNHPLFVMFSSGTTGAPKCIVHGAGGTLLEHLKEHRLHGDLGPGDRICFHTSCGWMMWNWLISGMLTGATVVVREGSPTHPESGALWKMVQDEGVTVLGVNPTLLQYFQEMAIRPGEQFDLSKLRAVQSTGSVLFDQQFDWFLDAVARVPLQSISGGTDILGCFVLGHPHRPLVRGESQMVSLGLDVRTVDEESGIEQAAGHVGELICANPFPSRPVGFLGADGPRRFHETYFAQHEGVWTHGDLLAVHADGGARMLGRSDGVLNVRGIRIGPVEIYDVLQGFEQIAQALAVEETAPQLPGGMRVVLLVVMQEGVALDRPLTLKIKKALKEKASANHVPGLILDVPSLPITFSGKPSEKAARDAVNGREAGNRDALRNPESLDRIRERMDST